MSAALRFSPLIELEEELRFETDIEEIDDKQIGKENMRTTSLKDSAFYNAISSCLEIRHDRLRTSTLDNKYT